MSVPCQLCSFCHIVQQVFVRIFTLFYSCPILSISSNKWSILFQFISFYILSLVDVCVCGVFQDCRYLKHSDYFIFANYLFVCQSSVHLRMPLLSSLCSNWNLWQILYETWNAFASQLDELCWKGCWSSWRISKRCLGFIINHIVIRFYTNIFNYS